MLQRRWVAGPLPSSSLTQSWVPFPPLPPFWGTRKAGLRKRGARELRRDRLESQAGRGPVGRANKGRCPIKAAAEAGVQARAHRASDSNDSDSAGSRALAFGEEVRGLLRKVGTAGTGLVG